MLVTFFIPFSEYPVQTFCLLEPLGENFDYFWGTLLIFFFSVTLAWYVYDTCVLNYSDWCSPSLTRPEGNMRSPEYFVTYATYTYHAYKTPSKQK